MKQQITQQQRDWMTKAILNSVDLAIFQHETEALTMMFWKYSVNTEIEADELSEDLKYLDNLAN